jgi:hypothetical protein
MNDDAKLDAQSHTAGGRPTSDQVRIGPNDKKNENLHLRPSASAPSVVTSPMNQ